MLEVKNLTKHFQVPGKKDKFVHAVDNVSFKIEKGKTLGLVGESGCGKSTCARTIIRIYEPTSGEIFLDGDNITNLSQKELLPYRKKIQMIFQDPYASLNARMTVRDIIAEPLIAHNITDNKKEQNEMIEEILSQVGLSKEHLTRYAHEFSGGQRQRIGIARALILKPDVVICDEPISALDVSIQAQIINLLIEFQEKQNLTYLFIAHDLSMVKYVSDSVGVMYLGELVELSNGEDIYKNPLHPYTQGLLSSIPLPDPTNKIINRNTGIEGDIPSPIDPPAGCRFHTRCRYNMKICKEQRPEFKELEKGHFVSCHLYNK